MSPLVLIVDQLQLLLLVFDDVFHFWISWLQSVTLSERMGG